jgi:hypothetical protein
MKRNIQHLVVVITFLSGFKCIADIINIELESPFTRNGSNYAAAGTNSTNVLVASNEKIIFRQHHIRHGYTYYNGSSLAQIKAKYGASSNLIQVYINSASSGGSGTSDGTLIGKTIYGPCTLYFDSIHVGNSMSTSDPNYGYNLLAFYSLEKEQVEQSSSSGSSVNTVSAASIVVPSNATGDVDVLLEQSNDMITWTQCLPGTYNASTQKRFFRVRAVEK